MKEQPQIVRGPVLPGLPGDVIYSVTLSNGHIVTNPSGFGDASSPEHVPEPMPIPPRRPAEP